MKEQLMYLDAGTGSLIVSVIVAGAAGLGVFLRLGWRRITGFFSPRRRAEQGTGTGQEPAEQELDGQNARLSTRTSESAEPRA